MTAFELAAFLAAFVLLLALGGLWADAWFTTDEQVDAKRRNMAHRR